MSGQKSIFLSFILLLNLRGGLSVSGWSRAKQRSINTAKGSQINITYAKYKRNSLRYVFTGNFAATLFITMNECAQRCTDNQRCLMWHYQRNDMNCNVYEFTLLDQKTLGTYNPHLTHVDSYELQNPCTENQNLCEHGSYCAANRINESHQCKNCLPPFTGQYCNETTGTENFISANTTKEILFGHKTSCRYLLRYDGISSTDFTVQYIHPWRDDRKIKVLCQGGYMVLSHVRNDVLTQIREITWEDLHDGLDLTIPNFRAHTSFLKQLYKLIDFDKFQFKCSHSNGTEFGISNNLWLHSTCRQLVKYMTDNLNVNQFGIPSTYCLKGVPGYTNIEKTQAVDERWSTPGLSTEERPFSDVVVLNDGTRYSFGSTFECFDQDGLWTEFKVEIW